MTRRKNRARRVVGRPEGSAALEADVAFFSLAGAREAVAAVEGRTGR